MLFESSIVILVISLSTKNEAMMVKVIPGESLGLTVTPEKPLFTNAVFSSFIVSIF